MRIDKLLAHAGYGSRKDVKQLLKNKIVTVDDEIVSKPNEHVDPDRQRVCVNGEKVVYEKNIYLMLHKPQGYLSATYDAEESTVLDLVPEKFRHYDLSPVGRLDKNTEGFILLTNDGLLNHMITSPKNNIYKKYFAKIAGKVTSIHVEQFKKGIQLDDNYITKPAYLEIIKSDEISEIYLSISEGKFHQVKRMFQALDMKVIYLKRVSIGELSLDESLKLGESRLLTEEEMTYIHSLKNK